MIGGAATHRGAPFAGRRREIGILTHLLEEGLAGKLALIRVAASAGTGRRRLIHEALRHGPDAEWIHLAPGGVEADLVRWMRTELIDLLDTYPGASYPSWALHVVSRYAPRLGRRAATPRVGAESFPAGNGPELVGAAIGALLQPLTDRTLVVVEAGLWPEAGSPRERALGSLARSLKPAGTVLLAAGPETSEVDPPDTRTLSLQPWRVEEITELATHWFPGSEADPDSFATYLYTVSAGHPFFLHETLRWLEELGHLHIDDDHGRIDLLSPIDRLPLPLFLNTVLEARYRRLPPDAARLLHLLSGHDGRLEVDAVRRASGLEDEAFEEALTILRRRDFLLWRTHRRPLALASPLWRRVAEEGAARFSRQAHRPVPAEPASPREVVTPLARARRWLDEAEAGTDPAGNLSILSAVHRSTLGRRGPAWDGIRGRLALAAAARAIHRDRPQTALRWTARGLRRTEPAHHPGLRRALRRQRAELQERWGAAVAADRCRRLARDEAVAAGHLVAAAVLDGVCAESTRRRGRPDRAEERAAHVEPLLRNMGLEAAERAGATHLAALLDQRRLAEARAELNRRGEHAAGWSEGSARLQALEKYPPLPAIECPEEERTLGWGWGLDDSPLLDAAREFLAEAAEARRGTPNPDLPSRLRTLRDRVREAGLGTAAADLSETLLHQTLESPDPGTLDTALGEAVRDAGLLESPERRRFLAESLRATPAGERPGFREHLAPELLHPVSTRRPSSAPTIRLRFTGRGRLEGPGRRWPRALWPLWWGALWSEVLVREFSDREFPREDVIALLARYPDVPRGNLESVVHAANDLLTGTGPPPGGLHLDGRKLVVSWDGIEADVREFLRAGDRPSADPTIRAAPALTWIEGEYLAGFEDPGAAMIRRMVRGRLRALRDGLHPRLGELDATLRVAWAEGPGRLVPLEASRNRIRVRRETPVVTPGPGSP